MTIDAHHHLWSADYPWLADTSLRRIRRDYTFDDLRPHLRAARVDHTVLVEAGICRDSETSHFLALADRIPEIVGVVGWASLTDARLAMTLKAHRSGVGGRFLVGMRDQVQSFATDHLDLEHVRTGLRAVAAAGLVNELVVRCDQLPSVGRVATALPQATFVLDHLGKPRIASRDGFAQWRDAIGPVAQPPNVVAKLSGLVTEADWAKWKVAELAPYVAEAVDLFGPDRLMFGSDWPVCEVAAKYEEVVEALETILGGRPEQIFGGTAQRIYGLECSE